MQGSGISQKQFPRSEAIQGNKQKLEFGCTRIGGITKQTVVIRNNSPATVRLEFSLKRDLPGFKVLLLRTKLHSQLHDRVFSWLVIGKIKGIVLLIRKRKSHSFWLSNRKN